MKNKLFKILIISYLSFFVSSFAMAADCNWITGTKKITNGGIPYKTCPEGTNECSSCSGEAPQGSLCCSIKAVTAAEPKFKMPDYVFQIPVPGYAALSKINCTDTCEIPWISEYIFAIYNYGLTVVGVIAVLILMAAGILWIVSGGDSGKITKAKEMIMGSVTGLLLLVSMTLLLSYINPDLIKKRAITLDVIKEVQVDGDSNAPVDSNGESNLVKLAGLNCGQDTIKQMVDKTKGKVTYDSSQRGKAGPNNSVYLDCSSYASLIWKCAGYSSLPAYTGDIFQSKTVFNGNISSLSPGDLIGWSPNPKGHVLIYLGGGKFGDCHGGSGRQPGNAIANSYTLDDLAASAKKNSDGILYIRKK